MPVLRLARRRALRRAALCSERSRSSRRRRFPAAGPAYQRSLTMNAPRERRRLMDGAENPNAETASQQGPPGGVERRERVATAAYYNAERRGFQAGSEVDDWLEAEKQIDRLDSRSKRPSRLEKEIGSPDHMVAREPLPSGQPHDPAPKPANPTGATKKPERR